MKKLKFYKQQDKSDCGAACVKSVLEYYGHKESLPDLRRALYINKDGISVNRIVSFLQGVGIEAGVNFVKVDELTSYENPLILYWNKRHFVILEKIILDKYHLIDPAIGRVTVDQQDFLKKWGINGDTGLVIHSKLPDNKTHRAHKKSTSRNTTISFKNLLLDLLEYRKSIYIILFTLILGSIIQLIVPFLTQSIVDRGIANNDLGFIELVIVSQLFLFIGSSSMDFFRSWLMLHIGLRINIKLSTQYVTSLIHRNISFFSSKKDGDFLERLVDNSRIEQYLTQSTLALLIAVLTLIIMGTVLLTYNGSILLVYVVSSALLVLWVTFFLKKRKQIDNERFSISSQTRSELLEIIRGIEEIKLNNLSRERRDKWVKLQVRLLKIRMKLLLVGQYQKGGAMAINQLKNVIITFFAAKSVLDGSLTIGAMLAIQYVVGQLNSPIRSIISFIQERQDAQLSFDRLSDVIIPEAIENATEYRIDTANTKPDIRIHGLSFSYGGENILKHIELKINYGDHVAIVGESGSGKTTLLKILAKLLHPTEGIVNVGEENLSNVSLTHWASKCSVVFQEGHMFSDTLLYNITLCADQRAIDRDLLVKSISCACLENYIDNAPLGLQTLVGRGGKQMSKGQQQRIFIARSIYKNGEIVLLDEASSALDNITEFKVLKNVKEHFRENTLISVTHKLHTISDFDLIVFIKDKIIAEKGSHEQLMQLKGLYYNLFQQVIIHNKDE